MALQILRHNYNGSLIPQREEDGYVSLTAMAKANGKEVAAYLRLKSTKAYIEGLSLDMQIDISKLVVQIAGRGDVVEQGTWAHREIAMDFAQWINVPFRIWANRTLVESVKAQQQPQPQSDQPKRIEPTIPEQMQMMESAFKSFGLLDSPRHMQLAKDYFANMMEPKALPSNGPQWLGVAEIAEQLGYDKYQVSRVRSGLGRAIAAWHRSSEGEPRTEQRIVNGRNCELKVYQRTNELDTMIVSYLEAKGVQEA